MSRVLPILFYHLPMGAIPDPRPCKRGPLRRAPLRSVLSLPRTKTAIMKDHISTPCTLIHRFQVRVSLPDRCSILPSTLEFSAMNYVESLIFLYYFGASSRMVCTNNELGIRDCVKSVFHLGNILQNFLCWDQPRQRLFVSLSPVASRSDGYQN